MEKIIKKAIEGGWGSIKPSEITRIDVDSAKDDGWVYIHFFDHESDMRSINIYQMLFDPLFWQALGKSCGWNSGCNICSSFDCNNPKEHLTENHLYPHITYALSFYEINLTESFDAAIQYLESITN